MSKRFLLIMGLGVALFIGLLIVNKQDNKTSTDNDSVQPTNHTFGESPLGINITEYGDFQCPACFSYFPIFSQLKEEYRDRVVFQFRNFPLASLHQNAMVAHRAAEAAALQDKFWEMHDLLFQNQKSWERSTNAAKIFEDYAAELGLDIDKFKADAASSEVNAKIQADLKAGQDLGVGGTPTFVVDGKVIETPNSIDAFREIIEGVLAEKENP